jgi:Domain of unknown function (DUF4349)
MRLPDRFRRHESDERLAAEVERELLAVDGALAGLELHPDFDELAALAVAIRDERPAVDEEFAALLDERAAAGFPRPEPNMRAPAALTSASERLAGLRPRRLLALAGAAATLLVVVGVSISVLHSSTNRSSSSLVQTATPTSTSSSAAGGTTSGSGGGAVQPESLPLLAPTAKFSSRSANDEITPSATSRKVAQNATLTLSTDPDKVRTIASSVTDIVAHYHGLVISSSITSGKGSPPPTGPQPLPFSTGALGAEFQLRIPANKLNAALDDLSKLGLVVSREQGTKDITSSFVDVRKQIKDLEDERDQLISQLSQAITQEAIDAINARLKVVRNEIDHAQGNLGHLQQRVAVVPVHVSVVAKGSGGNGDDGGFDLGDAVHDAGRVLVVGAGVLLISLAVIVPLALIATLAWFAVSRTRRRRRERALD